MKTLTKNMDIYILRHGKAEENTQNITSDSKRRLTEAGKKELEIIAKAIKNLGVEFDTIVSSPLIRSKQTAEIILKYVKNKKKSITIWDELKPEIDVSHTIKKLTVLKSASSVLLVGHEPHLTTFIGMIISNDPNNVNISLKKGGFVHIKANQDASEIFGSLRSIMTPKQLKLCK